MVAAPTICAAGRGGGSFAGSYRKDRRRYPAFTIGRCTPGVSMAVVRNGKMLLAKACSMENLETGTMAMDVTVFHYA
jgi:hypothetical protein